MAWAHGPPAQMIRNAILCYVLGPIISHYTHPRVLGREIFAGLSSPVVFAANHSSHLDTPVILRALPSRWRRETAVVAAADYFFRNRLLAGAVSLAFGAVPVERRSGLSRGSAQRLNEVIAASRNLLVYPEGTRSRNGDMGILRSGAARLAVEHGIPVVPISVKGTHDAMPPGRLWPRHHPVFVRFGPPICPSPDDDHKAVTARLERSLHELHQASDI
jgi:1-acyl-sn-glycerol-3-phosphate acyltransferase